VQFCAERFSYIEFKEEKKLNKDVKNKCWIRGEEYGGPPDRE